MKLRQLAKNKRRLSSYLGLRFKYMTVGRFVNFLRVERDFRRRKIVVASRPYELILDTTNICQLRCPLCSTGMGAVNRRLGHIPKPLFQKVIDQARPHAWHVFLHNWGEPLLNEEICDHIEYAHRARMGTTLSTNLSMRLDDEFLERLIRSGLDRMVLSVDGANAESYARYRVRGRWELVLENMHRIVATRRRLKSRTPFIEWQYLVMKHNEHEMDVASDLAEQIGVDNLEFVTPTLVHGDRDTATADAWLSDDPRFRSTLSDKSDDLRDGACWWLWRAIVVNPDGGVGTCCYLDKREQDLGSAADDALEDLWNSDYYQSARALFSRERPERPLRTACHDCSVVTSRGSDARSS